jgi:hypothetical protein
MVVILSAAKVADITLLCDREDLVSFELIDWRREEG